MLKDPEAMYPGQRKMQNYDFTEATEIAIDLVAFFEWAGGVTSTASRPKPPLARRAVGGRRDRRDRRPPPAVFNQICMACHSLGGQGGAVGPALDGVGTASTPTTSDLAAETRRGQARHQDAQAAPHRRADRRAGRVPQHSDAAEEGGMREVRIQRVAWWFFATCMLLLTLQIVYGFIMGFAHMGLRRPARRHPVQHRPRDPHQPAGGVAAVRLHGRRLLHHPRGGERELMWPKLAYVQLGALVVVGVTAVIGFHFNWWEGRKFLEIPRPLDFLVVVDVLRSSPTSATIWKGKRMTTTAGAVLRPADGGAAVPAGHDPHRPTRRSTRTGAGGWCTSGSRASGS
jgi:mono/diheme cytochrome c family protein